MSSPSNSPTEHSFPLSLTRRLKTTSFLLHYLTPLFLFSYAMIVKRASKAQGRPTTAVCTASTGSFKTISQLWTTAVRYAQVLQAN